MMMMNPFPFIPHIANHGTPVHRDNAQRKEQNSNHDNEPGRGHDISEARTGTLLKTFTFLSLAVDIYYQIPIICRF